MNPAIKRLLGALLLIGTLGLISVLAVRASALSDTNPQPFNLTQFDPVQFDLIQFSPVQFKPVQIAPNQFDPLQFDLYRAEGDSLDG